MRSNIRSIVAVFVVAACWASPIGAQQPAPMGRGMMGAGHDTGIMTGVHELFMGHAQLTRTVTTLPDGIRTVTESSDARLAQLIKDHVTISNAQVVKGVDPGLPMESDALRAIFALHADIRTTIETTAKGVIVTQTSSNPKAVAALQQHAEEVTTFVNQGMAAMRDAMMKKRGK
jgi:hypothetical protein